MAEPMSDERRAEIRQREQAATPGPWSVADGEVIGLGIEQHGPGSYSYDVELAYIADQDQREEEARHARNLGRDVTVASAQADAEFVAHARTDVPDLLAEVARLRAELELAFSPGMYLDIQKVLDEALGTNEADSAGAGITADVALLAERMRTAEAEAARLSTGLAKARAAHDERLKETDALRAAVTERDLRIAEHRSALDLMQSSALGFQTERDHAIRLLRQAIDLRQNGMGDTTERTAWQTWDLNASAWLGRGQPGALCRGCKEKPPHRPGHPDLVGEFCEGCINTCHQADNDDHTCPVCQWPGAQQTPPAEGAPDAG